MRRADRQPAYAGGRAPHLRLPALALVAMALLAAHGLPAAEAQEEPPAAAAKDVVHFSAGKGRGKMTGQVLDYDGHELRLRMPGGKERSIPADRVLRVETTYTTQQQAAEKLFAALDFAKAKDEFQLALKAEQRVWVRRQIVSRLVRCCRAAGDSAQAGEFFLLLLRSDPDTQYFDCIPLAWQPGEPDAELARKARQWIEMEKNPPAVLLGASHLLASDSAGSSRKALERLAEQADPRIAGLARAQTWRLALATVRGEQISDWLAQIERLPEPLRGGPYFVAGMALARQKRPQPAALALLRVPILYADDRPLAARALLEAGRALEQLDQNDDAQRLYQEAAGYSGDPSATEARQRVKP